MVAGLETLLHRARPSAWQLFLRQPCVYLARLLVSWHPVITPQRAADALSIVYISDTYNSHP